MIVAAVASVAAYLATYLAVANPLALLFGIASLAMLRGVRRHRDVRVLFPFVLGIVIYFMPRGEEGSARDISLAVASSVGLVSAHVLNLRALAASCC